MSVELGSSSADLRIGRIGSSAVMLRVQSNATLAVEARVQMSYGDGTDAFVMIESRGHFETQGFDTGRFYDNTISLEAGAEVVFSSGNGLGTLAEVESFFGTTFLALDGATLSATDNGDGTFTVTATPPPVPLPDQVAGPNPADGSTNQLVDVDLSWAIAANAESYNVYFGATGNKPSTGQSGRGELRSRHPDVCGGL